MSKNAALGFLALTFSCLLPGCDSPGSGGSSAPAPAPAAAAAGAGGIVTVTDTTFAAEVLQAKMPVLVDFWAPWCGPCKLLAPTIAEVAREYQGKVKVAKVSTDDNREVSTRYEIQGIPCVILFREGKEVQRIVGLNPKSAYTQLLERQLAGN